MLNWSEHITGVKSTPALYCEFLYLFLPTDKKNDKLKAKTWICVVSFTNCYHFHCQEQWTVVRCLLISSVTLIKMWYLKKQDIFKLISIPL